MKDKNGIEIKCKNCANYGTYLFAPCMICGIKHTRGFKPTKEALEARIAELQNELNIVQESERAEAQEADRLRGEVKELKAHNEVLQKRVEEFSMELLDRTMKENKDVLERLKEAEREDKTMEEVTIKNYQELAMRTCLPSAKNWEYCYCLIASEIGEAFGKWGKKFRDGEFDKDKLTDELGDVFWGLALACELGGYTFDELWDEEELQAQKVITFPMPNFFKSDDWIIEYGEALGYLNFAKTFAKECGIDPLECLRRNIAKLAGRKERGTLGGNGDNR